MTDLSSEHNDGVTITGDINGVNKDSLFLRQLGFFNPSDHPDAIVTFVGVGGIGSFAAFATAKLGIPNITLIDMDTVEMHNAPNQMHPVDECGESKVDSLRNAIVTSMGEAVAVNPIHGPLEDVDSYSGVVISGLDSMAARQELWATKIKYNPSVSLYVDARIAGQLIQLYTLCPYQPDEVAAYEKTLFSDAEAEDASCTERGLIDVGFQCGALISRQIRKFFSGDELDNVILVNEKTLSVMKGGWQ